MVVFPVYGETSPSQFLILRPSFQHRARLLESLPKVRLSFVDESFRVTSRLTLLFLPTQIYCPRKSCSALVVAPEGHDVTQAQCPSCEQQICARCSCEWHTGTRDIAYSLYKFGLCLLLLSVSITGLTCEQYQVRSLPPAFLSSPTRLLNSFGFAGSPGRREIRRRHSVL